MTEEIPLPLDHYVTLGRSGHDPAKRDRLVIAPKFGGNMFKGDVNGGSNRKSILMHGDASQRRLRTDYIDEGAVYRDFRHPRLEDCARASSVSKRMIITEKSRLWPAPAGTSGSMDPCLEH
jgi:hypothetical protein